MEGILNGENQSKSNKDKINELAYEYYHLEPMQVMHIQKSIKDF